MQRSKEEVRKESYRIFAQLLYQLTPCITIYLQNSTCGLWYPETKTLEEAQINKIDIIGRKLKLKPGMKVLDIGGGFGAAAKHLAENYGVSVTVYNISKEQVKFGREHCKDVDVNFVLADYRTATGMYDAIYSIGFFEHVGTHNFRGYFDLINKCLKPEGLALTHTIISSDHQVQTGRWINKYIFPGGELPHLRDLLIHSSPELVTEDVQSFAKSYAKIRSYILDLHIRPSSSRRCFLLPPSTFTLISPMACAA